MKKHDLLKLLKESGGEEEFAIQWADALKCITKTWQDPNDCKNYVLEECFPLDQDPELAGEGVEVCARVVKKSVKSHNRIAFKKGDMEGVVACTHTAICDLPLGEAAGLLESAKVVEFAKSLEEDPKELTLPPWEHFKALRSYVAGVADMGIANMVLASYAVGDPGELPFGFNAEMQSQVMKAIDKVAPNALNAVKVKAFHEMFEGNPDWLKSRFDLLDERFKFAEMACKMKDPDFLGEVMLAGGALSVFHTCPVAAGEVLAIDQTLAGQLATDEALLVREAVARNEGTPPALLEHLAGDVNDYVRRGVVHNKGTPPAVLEQLARDGNATVRMGVARNEGTPPAALEILARDENKHVREGVARNKGTPPAMLEQLAGDENWIVRVGVAWNESTPPALLEQLARDWSAAVRLGVAANPNTPIDVRDESYYVPTEK